MNDRNSIEQQLDQLKKEFVVSMESRMDQLLLGLDSLHQVNTPNETLHEIFRQLHSLSGSAGTFGFHQLGEHCKQMELMVKKYVNVQSIPEPGVIETLKAGLESLANLLNKGPDAVNHAILPHQKLIDTTGERLVVIVEDDYLVGQDLTLHLNYHGYHTQCFSNATEAQKYLQSHRTDALLLDIDLPEGALAGTDLAREIKQHSNEELPCLFMTMHDDWDSRLAAVRAGGCAYLKKPVDVSSLVEKLDRETRRVAIEPYRVLVLDDDVELAAHYKLILRQAGMHAEVLAEPEKILQTMESFKPDIILMDYHLQNMNGMEIAEVVRQHPSYFSLSIVFLSSESDPEIQFNALKQGDEFLQKPIRDDFLLSVVTTRIDRSRSLNRLMYQDGLTGLLNQITLRRRLESEIARSVRQASPLTYVMIDLDHFKSINDRYGHAMGDQVLKSIARLLKDRLRKSDLVGRYGGEEFGLILPDLRAPESFALIDDLRQQFEKLFFHHEGESFSCSYSAGIASVKQFADDSALIEAADVALYEAKEKGRNQVVINSKCEQK